MSLSKPLWIPSENFQKSTLMYKFLKYCNFDNYDELYSWSINNIADFWKSLWNFCNIVSSYHDGVILTNEKDIQNASFFPNTKLNFAENLLKRQDDNTAIYFFDELGHKRELSFKDLYIQVGQVAQQMRLWNIQPGDVVAGYLPNLPETVIAMLAASSLGAIWSACSPDFGINSVLDRFTQVRPKIFFTCNSYFYNGKIHNCLERLPDILEKIPSIENVVVVNYSEIDIQKHKYISWSSIIDTQPINPIVFEQLTFNHPLFIMFSSGTTGKPKCIVHGSGGTLIQHLKEHQLHSNIKKNDRVFYYTTCSWMMWHWLVSSLATEASIILYEGSPTFPNIDVLFDIAEKTKMTFFGTSAKYLASLEKENFKPKQNLEKLRTIASTGSPLAPTTFQYVYNCIKKDVHLASIAGGTDIISCFMLGNPLKPVYKGQLQGAGLGLAVNVFNDDGNPIIQERGELVCTKPFPSRPVKFWNDIDNSKYSNAYFSYFPNIWHHGDFVEKTKQGGFIIYGRSDAVLNPGGVRIGTAEIYQQVEVVEEVLESLAIGQHWYNDIRIILFVILKPGVMLDENLIKSIKQNIRKNTTPRHVPSKIIQVNELPKTNNGKIAELAVRQMIHGQQVKNIDSLANPKSLNFFISNFIKDQLAS